MKPFVALAAMLVTVATAVAQPVTEPPEAFFQIVPERDRDAARAFYRKYIDVKGLPVVAAQVVDDRALQRTYEIVTHMLAGRPDVLEAMARNRMYLIVIGKDQVYTDMPEYRNTPNPEYMNERVRGTGGRPTSFGEENLLSLPIDRYDDESIGVHEFVHTIDSTLRSIDPTWNQRKNAAFRAAMDKGLWRLSYAAGNSSEFFAEAVQSYFDCNRVNNWNHGPIGTREQLKAYDPATYELVRTTLNLAPEQDWRYSWIRELPGVYPPPAKFNVHPSYTKFTWAREFPIVGSGASDDAMLKANDTVRKMFAYRHDVLKALINDGVKLVVLGSTESLSQLPELKGVPGLDLLARTHSYSPETKLIVVDERNLLSPHTAPLVGGSQLVREFAKAVYVLCGSRPVDPNWNERRDVQQYELRVKRLDVEFGDRVRGLHASAVANGKWKGTSAVNDPASYWAAGVCAYFDAAGQDGAPNDAAHPIATRELLKEYDPELFALVHEVMAYEGHVDWRLTTSVHWTSRAGIL
jgi:alpha-glucosidase